MTPTQICNLALAKVGDESAQITSLPAQPDEKYSKEANLCSKFYPVALREELRATEWKWARKRASIARVTDEPVFGWAYKHKIPEDCVRVLQVVDDPTTFRTYSYTIEWDVEEGCIVSNSEDLWMLYVSHPSSLEHADPLFEQALYTNIAAKLCFPLTEDKNLQNAIINEYQSIILPEARRVNGWEGKLSPVIDSEWVEATYINGVYNTSQHFEIQDNYGSFE